MEKIRLYFDKEANALNVWFDDPEKEYICEETEEEVILIRDRNGRVIGFEKLNFIIPYANVNDLPLEVAII